MVTIKIIPNTEIALPLINSVEMVVLHFMYHYSRFATTKAANVGGQDHRPFSQRIYMKMEFSS